MINYLNWCCPVFNWEIVKFKDIIVRVRAITMSYVDNKEIWLKFSSTLPFLHKVRYDILTLIKN